MHSAPPVRLGLIGLGNMGSHHARSLLENAVPGLQLTAVADGNVARLEDYPMIARFTDARELISSGSVDAVLIATPHPSHASLGIAAMETGLHLLVEKPIAVHKLDCEKLIAAHRPETGQVFATMFNQRTDPRYRKLRELLHDGLLGTVQRINWIITDWFRTESYYRSDDWRATWAGEGGGVLLNQCPHNLDLWQWLFGMPSRVIARCQLGRFHQIEVEDSVTAILEYDSGVQGVFVTTTGEAPGTNRLEVVGDHGTIVINGTDSELLLLRNERASSAFSQTASSRFARPELSPVTIPVPRSGDQYHGILKNFVAAIRGEAPLLAPGAEGIHSVELANAMLLSSFRDQPIRLPLDAADYAAELRQRIENSTVVSKSGINVGARA